jgi:Tol biopolymer transport system component
MPRQLTFDGTAGMPRLSPDGDFLAYTTTDCPVAEPCRENIKVQDLRGSAPVALDPTGGAGGEGALPVWFNSLDWSPDGLELIYTAAFPDTTLDGVFLIPRLGGSPQRIWAGTAGAAVFRPDGKAVDWISLDEGFGGNAVLRTLFRESGETTARALPLFATALQWSPDGRYLATAGRSLAAAGVTGVFALLDVEGAVRDSASFDMWAWPRLRWTRDGTGLFVTNGQGDLLRIPVDLDSGEIGDVRPVEVERLLAKDYSEFNFDVSGDERTVVFAQVLRSSKLRALERGPTDGVEARTLTTGTSSETFPSLSPDGALVAYLAQDHLGTNLYVRPFDGGPGRALVQTTGPKRMTTWSPQGDRVAYLSIEPEGDWLSIVPVAGGTPRRLTRAPGQIVAVDWMPDGERIVFRSEDGAISAVTLGGSVETLLTTPDDPEIQWGTLVSPSGDSVAVIGQDCRGVSCQDYVRVAPLIGGEWREIYSASWNVLKERAQKTWVTNDWTHVSPLGWTEEGIRFVLSRHVGDLAWTNEWLVSPSTMSAVHTADLTEECGAPTMVAMDATGHRRVCREQRWTSDIWMLEVR